ncbi:MAG: hypothetical protein WD070_08300 [Pirellulaceae bacterium]
MLEKLEMELQRLSATEVQVELDDEFEPKAGTLVKVSFDGSFWHLLPGELDEILAELPDGAGREAIKQAIERNAQAVWHGPAPKGSRDTL